MLGVTEAQMAISGLEQRVCLAFGISHNRYPFPSLRKKWELVLEPDF